VGIEIFGELSENLNLGVWFVKFSLQTN
jgi:hypothetical protein